MYLFTGLYGEAVKPFKFEDGKVELKSTHADKGTPVGFACYFVIVQSQGLAYATRFFH